MYQVSYTPSAVKYLRKLDRSTQRRLLNAIEELANDPTPPRSIHFKGGQGERRIRVGDYRVIYEVNNGELIILVLKIGHRRDVYRQLP
ncbi:type II toxin-antitoxin system RelE/ParE family toxin [Schaalia sp. Marseille-Q2122]|uniref:type II toxin-antitoxin system RelE family toxin n=1 Tax=Schaalia sp. Marseille-Q2122 TaxID=2736604 RepID=UPI00158A45A4|nr:type II toxin-antitoxin system RelE/ParE family toxin [Schaalia sp. Marseille-Q2122]